MQIPAIAQSGMRSASLRLAASAHNVANLATEDFHPLIPRQLSASPGSRVTIERSPVPRRVDLLGETVEQLRAAHQFKASLRVLGVSRDTHGALIDLLA